MAPQRASRKVFWMVKYQAFFDDSGSEEEFVLAGYIATAETWDRFAKEWKDLLPMGIKDKNGILHFKMTQMARSQEASERVELFYRLIEKYELIPISCRLNLEDFERAITRLREFMGRFGIHLELKAWENKFFFVFMMLVLNFYRRRHEFSRLIPVEDTSINFVFDKQSEEALLPPWSELVALQPEDDQPLAPHSQP